eukprot:CAMPEP_0171219512 /NCGR_PEP_ID=MMETSP0790-20130122/33756_1 /TAXON_ID=2925 /ORGANISM="Alexandrium catenella, Strain OF101" /LENGTH=160 /DNA_ID=CAMNT_0011685369 /DNA_START=119 /DNA_END=598 /DNA_ORIENTATION=-
MLREVPQCLDQPRLDVVASQPFEGAVEGLQSQVRVAPAVDAAELRDGVAVVVGEADRAHAASDRVHELGVLLACLAASRQEDKEVIRHRRARHVGAQLPQRPLRRQAGDVPARHDDRAVGDGDQTEGPLLRGLAAHFREAKGQRQTCRTVVQGEEQRCQQ